jgi:hypothetical protein
MIHMPLSRESQFLAPIAQNYRGVDRLSINLKNWPASANLAAQSLSPGPRRAPQVILGRDGVALPVFLPTTSIYDIAVSDGPLRPVFKERIAVFPCELASFGVRLPLFQSGKACHLLCAGFGIIAEK